MTAERPSPNLSVTTRRAVSYVTRTLVALFIAFYLAQYWWLAPNHTDDGLILTYIDDMAHGLAPHWDFIDAYGILNWVFPVLFYSAVGQKVWGIRLWLWIMKLGCVALTWAFVRRLTNRLYAALAVVWFTVFIGQPWQSMQTAYAFVNVVPMVLGAWYFILLAPIRDYQKNVTLAALCTTAAIWTKLNTGLYLFAGGLFCYFYWLEEPNASMASDGGGDAAASRKDANWFLGARLLGLVAYAYFFSAFTRKHFNVWFLVYLIVPLVLVLAYTGRHCVRDRRPPQVYLRSFSRYLATTTLLSLGIWFGYYRHEAFTYARELAGILHAIDYTAIFPSLGEPGMYVGLNEYYWLQLPWLLSIAYGGWIALGKYGEPAFGAEWRRERAVATSLFVLTVLHSWVMYARADETHIFQILMVIAPPLFVIFYQVERLLRARRPQFGRGFRVVVTAAAIVYPLTIAIKPTFDVFNLHAGEWWNPKFAYLRYRPDPNPYVKNFDPGVTDHEWDRAEDMTARYVDDVTDDNEEILALTASRLIHINSHTVPIGGRYHFLFYLVSVGLIDRAGFDALAPPGLLSDVLTHPPRVMIGCTGRIPPLILAFPEFRWLRDRWYVVTQKYRHILVYELRINGLPRSKPWRLGRKPG